MNGRKWNGSLWAGFLLSLIAFGSYFFFFVKFPVTRDFPWVNLLLFAIAALLLIAGLRRAYIRAESYRGKIFGPILATLSLAVLGLFVLTVFVGGRRLPSAHGSPQVGQKAPEFALQDTNGKTVTLSELLTAPLNPGSAVASASNAARTPKGVLLVFYRGYW